jgi:hypothetical protein
MLGTDSLTYRWIAPDLGRRVLPVLAAGWLGFGPGSAARDCGCAARSAVAGQAAG